MSIVLGRKPGGSGGGSAAPSGPAGGSLNGTYPNPGIADDAVTADQIDGADAADIRTLLDVPETGDVVLSSLYDAQTVLAATSDNTPVAVTMAASTILARLASGNIVAATVAQIQQLINADGWVNDTAATWTYASASTFTVAGDRTAVFTKGTRLRFTQTTVKYAVVVNSSHAAGTTTVTIAVNLDYTIANAAISVNSYSYDANPSGYPGWFNFTPTYTGFSANPAASSSRYNIIGTKIVFQHLQNTGTSNATTFTITMPVAARDTNSHMVGRAYNSGAFQAASGLIATTASSATLDLYRDGAGGAWTNSGAKTMGFTITVEF